MQDRKMPEFSLRLRSLCKCGPFQSASSWRIPLSAAPLASLPISRRRKTRGLTSKTGRSIGRVRKWARVTETCTKPPVISRSRSGGSGLNIQALAIEIVEIFYKDRIARVPLLPLQCHIAHSYARVAQLHALDCPQSARKCVVLQQIDR